MYGGYSGKAGYNVYCGTKYGNASDYDSNNQRITFSLPSGCTEDNMNTFYCFTTNTPDEETYFCTSFYYTTLSKFGSSSRYYPCYTITTRDGVVTSGVSSNYISFTSSLFVIDGAEYFDLGCDYGYMFIYE